MLQSLDRAEKLSGEEPDRRFTERLARQHKLLKRLRGSDDRANVSQLSRDFKVSRKTIIRDLRDLIQRHQLDPVDYPDWKDDLSAGE
jgi:transcriptional antiterminator